MTLKNYYQKNRLGTWIILLIIGGIITGAIVTYYIFPNYDLKQQNDIPNWTTLVVEVLVGIIIALIIYNHTRKIEERELRDLELTIVGTYNNLWNLYLSMQTYAKSPEVRADKILSLEILQITNSLHQKLPKCGQKIDSGTIESLQLNLVRIQNIIRALMDPRATIEGLWSQNKQQFNEIMVELKDISQEKFETIIPSGSKADWGL